MGTHHLLRVSRFAGRAGLIVAALVAVASLGGICAPSVYARETASWRVQGMAQDWVDLLIAAPWLAVSASFALRGSVRAAFLLGGALTYTAYSFVIYAFAMHFNGLFLVYVAAVGVSLFALADLVRGFDRAPLASWFDARAPRRVAAVAMMTFAALFAALWLADIVPALATGTDPAALAEAGLITNPVHILDLALVLPLLFLGGRLLYRGLGAGYLLGVVLLGFSVLMDLAILAMTIGLYHHGLGPAIPLVPAFAAVTVFFAWLLISLLRSLRPDR